MRHELPVDSICPVIFKNVQPRAKGLRDCCPICLSLPPVAGPENDALRRFATGPLILFLASILLFSGCKDAQEVTVVSPTKRDVEAIVSNVNAGTVKAERSAELAFGAVGRIKSVHVELGDRVKAGAILAEVENEDLEAGLAMMERELKRRADLTSRQISQSELDSARQGVSSAKMVLEKTKIRAPYDGIITEVNLEVGQLSQITAVIPKAPLRIIDIAPRYIRAEIDEADLPKVRIGMPARVKILAVRKEPFPGVVRKVVPYVSNVREQDRTSEIEVDVVSEEILPAGASADVEIVVDVRKDVLALPTRVVLGRRNDRYVFIAEEKDAVKRPVKVGLWNYDYSEILSEIPFDWKIILPTDLTELEDGAKIKVK